MGILEANPAIYKVMQSPQGGVLFNQLDGDYGGKFGFLTDRGYIFDAKDGRFRIPSDQRSLLQPTPWCHAKHAPSKHCAFDHNLVFNNFNIIPPRCLQCWKVVATPKTFDELMQLETIQKQMDVPCKCGIELRDYTPKLYGGYWYNNSLDEGRFRYEQVKKILADNLSEKIAETVILKRGCTEYEMIKGPSPYWHMTDDEEEQLEIINSYVDVPRGNTEQQEVQKKAVRIKWFLYAHMNADMSYLPYNNDTPLFPGYVPFHEGNIDDIKKDLIMAQNNAKYGTPMEVTSDFLENVQEYAEKTGLKDRPGQLLGHQFRNPFEAKSYIKEVPDETKGDHDELT